MVCALCGRNEAKHHHPVGVYSGNKDGEWLCWEKAQSSEAMACYYRAQQNGFTYVNRQARREG